MIRSLYGGIPFNGVEKDCPAMPDFAKHFALVAWNHRLQVFDLLLWLHDIVQNEHVDQLLSDEISSRYDLAMSREGVIHNRKDGSNVDITGLNCEKSRLPCQRVAFVHEKIARHAVNKLEQL